MGQINMLRGHRITFWWPHPIKYKNMLEGRIFTPWGPPQLARGPRVADPWFNRKVLSYFKIKSRLLLVNKTRSICSVLPLPLTTLANMKSRTFQISFRNWLVQNNNTHASFFPSIIYYAITLNFGFLASIT